MRRNCLPVGIALLVVVVAIGTAACSDDDDASDEMPTATEEQTEDLADDGDSPASDVRIRGSGVLVTEEYEFEDFTKVELASAFRADISQSDAFSVSLEADDNVLEFVEVTQDGDTLRFDLRPISNTNVTLRATITMPVVSALELSAAAHVTLSGFPRFDAFEADLSGASSLDGELDVALLDLRLSGASEASFEGSGTEADIDASGASMLDLEDFILEIAHVDISGAAQGIVNVRDELGPVEVSGVSHLRFIGMPTLTGVDISETATFGPVD